MIIERLEKILQDTYKRQVKCEYDFLLQLYRILKYMDFPILLTELNALSGYSERFLYRFDFPEIYNSDINYLRKNLKEFVGIEISVNEFPSASEAEKIIRYAIKNNNPLILYPENLLIYGTKKDEAIFSESSLVREKKITDIIKVNNTYIFLNNISSKKRNDFYNLDIFKVLVDKTVKNFYAGKIIINDIDVEEGKRAYNSYIFQLRDSKYSFTFENPWFSYAIYPQWTAVSGFVTYLLGIHHFLDRKTQGKLVWIIKRFEDYLLYWREWERVVGRNAKIATIETSMQERNRAANAVKRAEKLYDRGITELSILANGL